MTLMDVLFRVATALFVIVAPTALFLGLWHGLMSLRDDDLASEVTARQVRGLFDTLPSGQPNVGRFEEVPDGGIAAAIDERSGRGGSTTGAARSSRATTEKGDGTERIETGADPDPVECSRCGEPNPPASELCWGCGAYLNAPDSAE